MSRKACCYDNAAMESFWATLKTECFQDQIPINLKHAQTILFDYIETFYNPIRLHSSLGYLSPIEFENRLASLQLGKGYALDIPLGCSMSQRHSPRYVPGL
jgi:transposase InsO family protein